MAPDWITVVSVAPVLITVVSVAPVLITEASDVLEAPPLESSSTNHRDDESEARNIPVQFVRRLPLYRLLLRRDVTTMNRWMTRFSMMTNLNSIHISMN